MAIDVLALASAKKYTNSVLTTGQKPCGTLNAAINIPATASIGDWYTCNFTDVGLGITSGNRILFNTTTTYVVDTYAIKGADGVDAVSPTAEVTAITGGHTVAITDKNGTQSFDVLNGDEIDGDIDYRFKYVPGTVYPRHLYNWNTKTNEGAGDLYTSLNYVLNGEKKIRFSGCNTGSTNKLSYCFIDASNNAITKADLVANRQYFNQIIDVPTGAYAVWINGNNYASPHLEVAVEDEMANTKTLPYLLNDFGKKLQYKDSFAWKQLPHAIFAFTFDDSNEGTQTVVDTFQTLGVPACFGTIPEKLNMSLSNGETVAQALTRGVANGCEILAHGSSDREIVTSANIDDMNFLYDKFVVNKQKYADHGFNVRGVVRVGGTGNLCGDARTDEWCKLFFDYGDLYGTAEPYNHARVDAGTTIDTAKAMVDTHIASKDFCPILYHAMPSYINELVAYIIAQGGQIKTYSYVYDTYGSTVEKEALATKVTNVENSIGDINTVLASLTTV